MPLKDNYDIWLEGVEFAQFPRTTLPREVETLIIGGGITGVVTAYLLAKAGKKVLLLEKGRLGMRITYATTGFLTADVDVNADVLIRRFGIENAKLVLESHKKAIDEVEQIIKSEGIECEFERCSNYLYANNAREEKYLIKLAKQYQELGVKAEYKKDTNLKFTNFGYIEMPGHAKFHAMKYLTALAKLAVKYGAIIAEDTEVLNVEVNNVEVKDIGIIKAKNVISATYTPFKKPKYLQGLANMYLEYVLEYKVPKGEIAMGTYEDTLPQYNYFRIDNRGNSDRMIIGGADHLSVLKVDREQNYNLMRNYAKNLFKNIRLEEVRSWVGSMLETSDGLAYIGETKQDKIFYMFGFSGNGMTYSYIAGKILLDKLTSKENPYTKLYKIDRKIPWWRKFF